MKNGFIVIFLLCVCVMFCFGYERHCMPTKQFAKRQNGAQTRNLGKIKYFKRWSLTYCLGYIANDDEQKIAKLNCGNGKTKEVPNMAHIENVVRYYGDELLDEIKAYWDKYMLFDLYEYYGKVNRCFDLIYDSPELEAGFIEIIKKYCKECK